jgi:hypothetical protein
VAPAAAAVARSDARRCWRGPQQRLSAIQEHGHFAAPGVDTHSSAHNSGHLLSERPTPARESLWLIERVDTLRKWWIQRAARITRHAGRLVITFAKGGDTESEIRRLLVPWGRAAA